MREIPPWRNQYPSQTAPSGVEIQYVSSPEGERPSLHDYWRMLIRRRRLIFVACLVVVALAAFVTVQTTPRYTASGTLMIWPQRMSVPGLSDITPREEDDLQTQIALLKSRPLAAKVIKNLGLESNPKFIDKPSPIDRLRYWLISRPIGVVMSSLTRLSERLQSAPTPETAPAHEPVTRTDSAIDLSVPSGLISRYLSFLTVLPVPKTQLVQVSFSTPDPLLSMRLANEHASAFIRLNLQTRFELTEEARDYLGKRLSDIKAKLEQADGAFTRFLQTHRVVSMEGNQNIVVDRMVDLNKRLTEARAKRVELESLRQIVKNKNVPFLAEIMSNSQIQRLKSTLESLQADEARLSTVFRPEHPRLQELSQQISQAQQRLNTEITNIVRGIESDYAAASARESALQAEFDAQQRAALNLRELGAQYTVLQGEVEANRAVYASILKQLNEASISRDTPSTNMRITEPAEKPSAPSSPRVERNLKLGAAFGLFVGVGLALLLEHLNPTIRIPAEVWRAVGLPTLGFAPHMRSLRRWINRSSLLRKPFPMRRLAHAGGEAHRTFSKALVTMHHPLSIVSEFYRTTRTSLLLSQAEQPLQIILLTSANAGEGKTTTTLNLGITLAQSGKRVIVVDADLRQGNCHILLGLQDHPGLTNIFLEDLTLEECLQATAVAGLSLLSRGAIPANPADLLGSPRMKEILQSLRERSDIILIDSPPAIAVSDAAILSAECDGVLPVLCAHKTTTEEARDMVERLEMVGARLIGVVLNGIDIRSPDFANYRHYYRSYYGARGREKRS